MRYRSKNTAQTADQQRLLEHLEPRLLLTTGILNDPITPDHPLWAIPRGEVIVDGVLDDAAWSNALEIFRTQATRHDRAVTVRMLYNDAGMFLSVDVEDHNIWADGGGAGSPWNNRWDVEQDDSVTFYFDPDGSRDQWFQSDDRAFGVNLGSMFDPLEGPGVVRRWKYIRGDGLGNSFDAYTNGDPFPGTLYASSIRGTVNTPGDIDEGWSIEIFLPWAALNMLPPTHGTTIGMNFDIIMDNDGGERNLIDNRGNPDADVRYLQPYFVDDHVLGAHSSYTAVNAGIHGPINYAEVMFIDPAAGQRPQAITNISVTNIGAMGATLNFTAPAGTLNGLGHVSSYEIRVSESPITNDAEWEAAQRFRQAYTPRLAGLAESLRIAELLPGRTYYVAIRAIDAAGNSSAISQAPAFTTLASPGPGYKGRVIPSPMGGTLMFENGEPFVVVGDHMGLSWAYTRQLFPGEVWDNANGVYQNFSTHIPVEGSYEDYFDYLRDSGVTTMRVYLELQNVYYQGNPDPPRGLYWIEHNAGQFNPDMRQFMHNVLREAGERGIRIIFSPFDSFSYDEAFGLEGPWASNFGGPLTDINDFFQTPGTLELAKARMAKVIQWANESPYAEYVLGWEPLSEWDSWEWTLNAEGDAEPGRETEFRTRARWINELGEYIKSIDPGRIVFNSTITPDPRGPMARQVFLSRSFDALSPHLYTVSNAGPLLNPQADKSVLPAVQNGYFTSYWVTHRNDGRPILNGEWGMSRDAWPNNRPEYSANFTQQQDEANFRVMIWTGLASGQLGMGLRINTEELAWNGYTITPTMRALQRTFFEFTHSDTLAVDFAHFSARNLAGRISAAASGHSLLAWGVSDGDQGVAYVLRDGNLSSGTISGGRLVIGGLSRNRIFDIEIWSTDPGVTSALTTVSGVWAPTGEVVIDLPNFQTDLAIKFLARPVAPQTQTLVSLEVDQYLVVFALDVDRHPYATVFDEAIGQFWYVDIAAAANFRGRVVDMTPFLTPDGLINLAMTDERSHVWHLVGDLASGVWIGVDHTAAIDGPGLSGDLTTYQPSWGSIHIAGLDARGHAINYWWAPGLTSWQYADLTVIADGPVMAGGLTGYVSGWDGLNLAGLDSSGNVVIYWWAPGMEFIFGRDTWVAINMTEALNGPRFVGQLDAYVTPWGGLNVAGRTADGQVYTYWWSPQLQAENLAAGRPDMWEIANITAAAEGPNVADGVEVAVSTDGGINIFAIDEFDEVVLFRWVPGGLWKSIEVTFRADGPRMSLPLAAASVGRTLLLAGRSIEDDGLLTLLPFRLDLDEWSVEFTPDFVAA